MAFNDDLNKFVHNYPYTNYHELVLDFLEKLVSELKKLVEDADLEHLPERLEAIESQLDTDAGKISALESFSATASEAIQSLRAITTAHTADLEAIHNEIDGVIDQLTEAIEELSTDLEDYKTATDSRLRALELAAFDPSQIVMSNFPFNFAISLLNGSKYGVKIVVDESVSTTNSITWVDGGNYQPTNIPVKQRFTEPFKIIRFANSGNPCHLVIPSVIPCVYRTGVNWTIYFYANRWIGAQSDNNGISYTDAINFTDLLAEGGVQKSVTSANPCFVDMELFPNQETGCYDLHIYNGRNGVYTANDFKISSIMILPINIVSQTQAETRQKYFNLFNSYLIQTNNNLDSRISSAINTALIPVNTEIDDIDSDTFKKSEFYNLDFTPLSGISVVANYSRQIASVKGRERYTLAFIDMILDVTGLTNNSTLNIGDFDFYFDNISGARSLEVAIEHANNGAFGSVTSGGSVAIKAFGTFEETTRIRVTASIADKYTIT